MSQQVGQVATSVFDYKNHRVLPLSATSTLKRSDTMTAPTMTLLPYLTKFGLQRNAEWIGTVIQAVIQAKGTGNRRWPRIGGARTARRPACVAQRNGNLAHSPETRVGELTLQILRLRGRSYFLEPRRRAEKTLLSVIQSAHAEAVSTRRADIEQ